MQGTAVEWSLVPLDRCEICGERERMRLGIRSNVQLSRTLALPPGAPVTTVFRCRGCRLVYCDPQPRGHSVEEVYGGVDDYFTIEIDEQRLDWYRRVAERLAGYREGRKGRLLDVGCGRGELVHAARQAGWDAHGIDPDGHFVEFARRRFGLTTVRAADLDDADLPRRSFDAVTLNGVLEHIPNPVETVRKAAALLAPGGVLFFEVPHGDVIRFAAADLVLRALQSPFSTHLSPFHPPYHLYEFSRRSVRRLAAAAGLDLLAVRYFPGSNRFPRGPGLRARAMRLAYGVLVRMENATGRTYNLHAFLRAPM